MESAVYLLPSITESVVSVSLTHFGVFKERWYVDGVDGRLTADGIHPHGVEGEWGGISFCAFI